MSSFPFTVASNDYTLHLDQPTASTSQHPLIAHYPAQPFPGESYLSTFGYRPWWGPQSCLFESGMPSDFSKNTLLSLDTCNPMAPFHRQGVSSLSDMATIESEFPSSPSELSSSSSETGPSPAPEFVHAVCNAPLVAPVPLPYHSPTFLQFDLPDDDEDLSHPPYVSRPHKRKRVTADELEATDLSPPTAVRRRVIVSDSKNRPARNHRSTATVHPMYKMHSGGYSSRTWQQQHQMPIVGIAVGGGMPG